MDFILSLIRSLSIGGVHDENQALLKSAVAPSNSCFMIRRLRSELLVTQKQELLFPQSPSLVANTEIHYCNVTVATLHSFPVKACYSEQARVFYSQVSLIISKFTLPIVGIVVTTRPDMYLYKSVVLPDPSKPIIKT